ncbi:hypothetical protein Y1Q_0004875 [Alligator mississippiensis]|uniref:Uncharacterized protein n=1 Tax=Alligator mississippiensis TaxID=8496 RepID=A0A151NQX5_ALLMI|nr:hypothetical protein Y1Q_0004875 [Alligator mississippiensis]
MSGCSKRCKHGIVKFAQTIFKLITGTLNKVCDVHLIGVSADCCMLVCCQWVPLRKQLVCCVKKLILDCVWK